MMISSIQFHPVHGEHIKLSRNNTIAKRVDSFCKGICFSNRTIQIREKIHVRLLNKSVQWTGFLRLGVTTSDPNTHRTASSLPRHACPDLTCRPGYWAKCVPENCFDVTNKLTYFYVDPNGELFLNTPSGEISLLTGISVQEPLWALLDIYGNCISIELVDDSQQRVTSQNEQIRNINPTIPTQFYQDIRTELIPLTFLPVHNPVISFFSSSSNALPDQSVVLYDNSKNTDGLVFFSEPLIINSGLLIHILNVLPSNESRLRSTTTAVAAAASTSDCFSAHIQFGLTNCNIKSLIRTNDFPTDVEQINNRTELWIIQDFKLNNKTKIDRDDEFLFTFDKDGIIEYSHNNSKLKEYIHLDPTLVYYPFLVFKGDIVAVRSMGYLKNLDKYRSLQQLNKKNETIKSNQQSISTNNNEIKTEYDMKLCQDCTVCLDRMRDTVLIPCGHICLCYSCAKGLLEHGGKQCPICRSSIQLINRIYLA